MEGRRRLRGVGWGRRVVRGGCCGALSGNIASFTGFSCRAPSLASVFSCMCLFHGSWSPAASTARSERSACRVTADQEAASRGALTREQPCDSNLGPRPALPSSWGRRPVLPRGVTATERSRKRGDFAGKAVSWKWWFCETQGLGVNKGQEAEACRLHLGRGRGKGWPEGPSLGCTWALTVMTLAVMSHHHRHLHPSLGIRCSRSRDQCSACSLIGYFHLERLNA